MTKKKTFKERKIDEFREKFVQQPLKDGGTFGWSKQDCGGAEMVENFISQAFDEQRKEICKIINNEDDIERTYYEADENLLKLGEIK